MQLNIIIGLVCTMLGLLISYLNSRRNYKNDLKDEERDLKQETKTATTEQVQLNTKLDIILNNNAEIKGDIKDINNKFDKFKDAFSERLTRCEETVKNTNKRLDDFCKERK